MLEGVVADVLARVLGQYVLGIDRDSVRVGVWSGQLELGRLALRAEALATLFESLGLDLPVVVSSGTLETLSVDVPWKRLGSEPVKVSVRSLALVAAPVIAAATGPAAATADARAEREARLKRASLSADDAVREAKWSVGADPTATAAGGAWTQASSSAATPGAPGAKAGGRGRWGSSLWGWRFTSRIVARIVDNIQVDLEDVTVRYEDAASVPSAPFALHASLGALRACSTDSSWSEVFLQDPLSPVVHKRIALSELSVAWVPLEASSSEVDDQAAVDDQDAGDSEDASNSEDAGGSASSAAPTHPTPPSETDERETPDERPQHYLVQPVSAEMRVAITKAWAVGRAADDINEQGTGAPGGGRAKPGGTRQARVSLDICCTSVGLTLAGEQYSTLLRAVLALSDLERRSPPRTPRERWAWAVERLLPRFRQRRAAAARFNEAGVRNWRLQREQYVDARVRLLHARRVANEEEDPVDRELVERIEADLDAHDIVFFRDLADEAAAKAAASATAAAEPIASATSRLWSVFSRARSAAAPPAESSVGVSAAADTGDGDDGLTLSAGVEVNASLSRLNEDLLPIVMPEPPDGSVSRSTSAAALGDIDSLSHDDPGDGDGPWNGGESMADAAVTPNLRVVFGLQRGSLRLQRYGAVPDPLADIIFRDLRVELETRPGAGLLLEALLGTFEVWDAQCNTKVVYPRVPWAPLGVAGAADTVSARRERQSVQRPPSMRTADGQDVSPDRNVDDVDGSALEHRLMDSAAYGAVDVLDALRAIRGGLHPSELLATGWQQSSSPPSSVAGVTTSGGNGSVDSSANTSSSPARAEDLTDDDIKARPLRHIAAMRLSRDAGADANVLSGSTRLALELAVGGVEMLLSGGPEGALAGVATFFSPRHTSPSVMAFLSAAAAPRLAAIRMEVQRALLERSVPPRLDVVIRGPRLLVPGPAAADPAAVVDLGTFAMDTAPPAELPPLSLHAALSARSISPATRSRRPLSASRLGGAAREDGQSDFDARDLLQKHSRLAQGSRGRSVDSDRLDGLGRADAKAVEYTDYRVAVSDLGIFLVPSLSQLSRAQRLVRPFSVHLRLHVLHNASFVEATATEGQRSALARLRLRGRVPALRVYLSHGAYRQLLTIARGWKTVLASAGVSPVDGAGGDGDLDVDSDDGLAESASGDGGEAGMASAEAAAVPERIQQLDVELTLGDASLELRERTGRRLITVEAAGSRLQAVRGRSGLSLRYALRSLTVTDGSRGGTAPFRRLVHAGVGNSHRGVSPPRSLPAFLGSPGASLVPTPVEGVTRSSSFNSLAGVEAGEAAASSSALSGPASVAADVTTEAAGGISGRLPPWPRGGLSSTLRGPLGEALVGPVTEPDRDFIKVVYSLDTSRREQSLKVRILSLHVVCVRETYLSVVKFFYLFDETPPAPVPQGLPDAARQTVEGGSAQYSDPFAAVGTTTSAAARRLAAKAERGLERGAANLARRGRLRLDAKLDGVSVDLISAEGALASLDVFSFRAGLRLDPSGAVAARGALAGFTVRDLTAAFPGHSSTVVYERLSPHRDSVGRSSGEGAGDGDVPDGFVCDSVDPHDVARDAEDVEDGFTLIVPPTAKGGDVWLRARMTNLRIVYLQRFVFIVNTYFAVLREGLAPVLQMQGGLSEIFDSSEPVGGAVPGADGDGDASTLPGDAPAGALQEGAPARPVKPHPRKRERRRLRLHVVTKGVDIVIPRHSQNAHEAVRLIVGHSVVSNEEAASTGYRLGLKLAAKGVNLYVLYPSLCKSGSAEDLRFKRNDAEGGSSDNGEELRPVVPGESVDGYTPFAADIYSEILVDWWRTGRVPRFTFDAQGIPVLVRMPSSPVRAKRASENTGGGNEQPQDAGTMLPALRLRFSAPQGISANLCEAEYTILYLTVTENFLERPDIEFTDIVAGLRTPIFPYRSPIPPLSLSSAPVPPNYRILFTVPVLRSIISHGGDPTAESARLISSTLTDVAGRFDYGIDCRIIFELSANLAGVDDARVGAAAKGAPRTVIMPMLAAPSDGHGAFGSRPAAAEPSGSASSAADSIASQAKTVSVSYDRPFGYRSNIMVAVSELRIIVVPELFRDLGLLTPPGLPYLVSTAPPPKARFNGRHVILTLARPEVWLRADQGPADQRALVLRGDVVVAKLEWAPVTMLISVDVVARAIRIGLTNLGVPKQAVPSGPGPWSGSSPSYPLTAVVSPPAAFGQSRDNASAPASGSSLTERETPLLYPSDISVEFSVSHDTPPSPSADAAAPNCPAAAMTAEAAASRSEEAPSTPTRSLTVTAESLLCRLDVHDTPLLLAVFSCFGRMSPTLLKLRPAEVELREAARLRALAAGGGGHRTARQSFHLASEDDGLHGADGYDDEVVPSSGSDGEENPVEDAVVPLPERLLSVFFSMPHARLLFTDETSGRYVPILEVRFRQTVANASVPWMASISTMIAVDLFSEARGVWEAGVEPFALHAAFSHGASGSRAVVVRVAGRLDVNVSPTTVHGAARVATAISSAIQELRPAEPGSSSPSSTGTSPAPGILVPGTAAPSTPPGQPVASTLRPGAASRGGVPLIRSVSAGGGSSVATSLRRPSVAAFCIRNDTGRPLVIWLPYDSTRRSLGSGREREVDVPTDELLLRAAAAAGRFDDADRARREALRCILALPGFEPVDVSAADVGIRTITLFPEQAIFGHATGVAATADGAPSTGLSSQAGPASTPIIVAWDVQMRDGVPIGTVRSVLRIINRTRTLLEVAIGAPPARSRYNYLQAQANDDVGRDGRPNMSYSGGGGGEQHLIRPDSSWAVPIYAVDRPLRVRPAIFHAPESADDDSYGRSPQRRGGSSNGLPGDAARSGVGVLYSYEWSDPLLSVANQCSLASRIRHYDTHVNRHARKSALATPVAGARKSAGSTLPDGPRWQPISSPGVAEWHSRGVPAAAPTSSAAKGPGPIAPVLACRAAIHGPAFHLAVHPSLCRQKPRRACPARYSSSSAGPSASTASVDECVDVSLRAPLLVDNTLPRSVSYKLAPVSSSGRAGAAVAATASALVQPLRTEHIHAVGRDISAFALALGYDNRPVAIVLASGAAATAREQREAAAGSAALHARSEWSQCASGYRLTLYSEFWVRNRSDTPVLLRERSSSSDVVGTGGTTALRARPPGVPADSYVCFSSGWISLRRAEVAPAARGGGNTETLTAAGDPWVSVSEELSDVDKPVQLFLGRGASLSVDVRPAGGRFGRSLIVTIRNVAWLNNSTNSAIQWCQPTTLTSRGIALSSMVHTLAVGETQALHWDVKESHSVSREICLRFVDSESGTSDWIWSRPIPVLAAKRGGGIAGDVAAKMYRPKRHEQYIARVSRSLLADGSPVVRVLREDRSSPPYRVVNACASRSIAFRQAGVNETHPWLVRPGKSTRYAWDDPHAPRKRRLLIVETIEHVDEDAPNNSVASSEMSPRESRALAGSDSSGRHSRGVPAAGLKDQSSVAAANDRVGGGSSSRTKGRSRRSGGDNVRDVHRPKFELSIDMVTADAGELCRTPRTFDPPMCISVAVQGPTKVVTFSDGKPRRAAQASLGDHGHDRRGSSSVTTSSLASSLPHPAQVPAALPKRSGPEQVQAVGDAGIPTIDLACLLGDVPETSDAPASSDPTAYPSTSSVTAAEDGAGSQASLPSGVPPASASRDADASSRNERAVASTDIEMWLEGVGISFVDDTPMEIAYLSATSLRVHIDTQPGSELAILQVADLQLDNQLPNAPWPVLLWAPPPPPASPFDSSSTSVPGANVLPANAHKPVLHIALDRFVFSGDDAKADAGAGSQQHRQQRVAMVKGAFAALQHLQLSLDEEFLLRAWMFVKSLKSVPGAEDDEDLSLEDGDHVGLAVSAVAADSPSGDAGGDGAMSWRRGPLYVERLLLCPIQLTVSLATARGTASFRGAGSGYRSMLRALLSAAGNVDRAELRFRALELHHALDTGPHFGHLVGEYYLAQLDAQKMALLSSSALVGNPSALFDSIAVGARDFFVEPARANGAADFIAGLGRGSSSLLTNTVGGLVGSLGGIPSAVALGLETAVGDRDYLAERESIRGRRGATSTPAQGLFTGALSFGHGLASGAAGLIREPVAGAMAGGPVGFLRGIGRGVVGGLVKPLAGALDLIGEPAAGFRAFISTERNRRAAEPVRPPRFFAPGPASRLVAFELRPALGDALLRALTRETGSEEESDAAQSGAPGGLAETVVDWVDLSGDEHSARGGARERERLLEIWAVLRRCAFGGARDRGGGGGGGGGGGPSSLAAAAKTENEVLAAQWLARHAHDRVALITSRRFLIGTLHGRIHFTRALGGLVDAHVPAAAGADYVLLGVRPSGGGGDPSRPAAAEWQRHACGTVAARNALHAALRAAIGADVGADAALTPRSARRAATAARRRQRDGSMEMVSFGPDAAAARRMPSL